ncbi:unnamed protein product [Discosporangium mesarthrocarpum]
MGSRESFSFVGEDKDRRGQNVSERPKKEAILSLVQELCQGPADNVPTIIRTALERGWRHDLQGALREFERKKRSEINRVCHRHYSEFIESVEELMKMRGDLRDLKDQGLLRVTARKRRGWATSLSLVESW